MLSDFDIRNGDLLTSLIRDIERGPDDPQMEEVRQNLYECTGPDGSFDWEKYQCLCGIQARYDPDCGY